MVATCIPQNNKENVRSKTPMPRRPRSHFGSSHTHATREAARHIKHSTPAVPSACALGSACEGKPPMNLALTAASSQRKISLPRNLQRPAFRAIAPAAISAVNPDLERVSVEYILEKLSAVGQRMHTAATEIVAHCPKGRLPRELEVMINDVSPDAPTHLFAVYSQPSALQRRRVTLHPIHAVVAAANCANLPPLPRSSFAVPDFPGGTVTLPVVPLCLPSPATFPILLNYMYTQNCDRLLTSLLPFPLADHTFSPEELARKVAGTFTVPALLSHASRVHGLWSNVAALGVFNDDLWAVMDTAWEILLGALAVSSGESWTWKKSA